MALSSPNQHLRRLLKIMATADNPVFKLGNMVQKFSLTDEDVLHRRWWIYCEMVQQFPEMGSNATFTRLTAEMLRMLIRELDRKFLGGALIAVFEYYSRLLHVRVCGSDELPTQCGSYSRAGIHHFINVSEPMILRAFQTPEEESHMVCGVSCNTRFEALMRVVEHELVHLLVYTNWLNTTDPHGHEFQAVAYGLFRHQACSHALPLPEGVSRDTPLVDGDRGCVPRPPAFRACTIQFRDSAYDKPEIENCSLEQLTDKEFAQAQLNEQENVAEDDYQHIPPMSDSEAEELVCSFFSL